MLQLAGGCVLVMFMDFPSIFGLDGRFAWITAALGRAVAACLGRLDAAMIVLVWRRVRRAETLLLALAERVRSGRYRGGSSRPSVAGGADSARVDASERLGCGNGGRLPRRFGWLIRLVPFEVGGYASQLSCVLAEPEMVALLRDVPQARRIVRPLLRMLGIVGLGDETVAVSAVVGVVRKRVRVARAAVDFGRIPLPRGVLAAARRQGFGKVV